jgi:hypothetical protein
VEKRKSLITQTLPAFYRGHERTGEGLIMNKKPIDYSTVEAIKKGIKEYYHLAKLKHCDTLVATIFIAFTIKTLRKSRITKEAIKTALEIALKSLT